jgi:ribosomal protein S18 acetylase RimI-like enzyme
MATRWTDALATRLQRDSAFDGCALRPATHDDATWLFELHRAALREYVDATWGWDDTWQRAHFAQHYVPARNALIVRSAGTALSIGRISLSRYWRKVYLRDIELIASERNRGLGSAVINAVLAIARESRRPVELLVLNCNPARRLYARLGFTVIADDGARLRMRAD